MLFPLHAVPAAGSGSTDRNRMLEMIAVARVMRPVILSHGPVRISVETA